MPPLYPAALQPPTRKTRCLARIGMLLVLLPWVGVAWADPVFDRAASLSTPPDGAREVGQGTGFFVSGDGMLLTASHLVQGCRRIDVVAVGGAIEDARVLRADRSGDLAALRVAAVTPALKLARVPPSGRAPLQILGFPDDEAGLSRRAAIGLNREARAYNPANPGAARELILRAPIHHGDSGGPILDADGSVVGLVQGILPDAAEVQASYGIAQPDIAVGPGLDRIRDMIRHVHLAPGAPDGRLPEAAVARVLCWK